MQIVVSVVHKITFWVMSINPIKFTLCCFFHVLCNVLGKMDYGPHLLFCWLTSDGYSSGSARYSVVLIIALHVSLH